MYRVGKKQRRALIDKYGHEVALFNKGKEDLAEKVCKLLNEGLPKINLKKSTKKVAD